MRILDFCMAVVAILALAVISPATSQIASISGFTANDGTSLDNFGTVVAISGGFALVSSVGKNDAQGKVYFFNCYSGTCSLVAGITANDGIANDFFGQSVSISGNLALIGAYNKNVGSNNWQGKAYLYNCNIATCSFVTGITPPDGATQDYFGQSVSISGNLVLIGAPLKNIGSSSNQGKAYLYNCNTASCSFVTSFTAPDGAAGDQFGGSVSISGNLAVIASASKQIGSNSVQGKVYVYNCNTTSCSLIANFTASDGASGDFLGASLSISGNLVLLGASAKVIGSNGYQGKAYLYTCNTTSCSFVTGITLSDGAYADNFGTSVSISGNLALISAPGKSKAYLFNCNKISCSLIANFTANDVVSGDNFGQSVSISDNLALVGANNKQVGSAIMQGKAYLAATSSFTGCVNGTVVGSSSLCSCQSGFTGISCNTNQAGSCPLATAQALKTTAVAEFVSGSIANNVVSFSILSPATQGRYFEYVQLSSAANCTYPGRNFIKGFQPSNCSDTISASIPFPSIANECGFTKTSDGSNEYYDGTVSVKAIEPVTTAKGATYSRSIFSSLLLQIILPRTISLNTTNVLTSFPIGVDAAVTRQQFNRSTDSVAIDISTNIDRLYILKSATILSYPSGVAGYASTALASSISGTCPNADTVCPQTTTLTITGLLANGVCNLNGNFVVQWNYNCRSSAVGCPLGTNGADQQTNLTISLSSNDLCGKFQIRAKLDGTLASYSSSQLNTTKSSFSSGETSFYQLRVTSDVTLLSIAFQSIKIRDEDNPATLVELYNGASNTAAGSTANLAIAAQGSDPSTISFSLAASAPLLSRPATDVVTFGIIVKAQVTYKTTFGRKKRDVTFEVMQFDKTGTLLPRSSSVEVVAGASAGGLPKVIQEEQQSSEGLSTLEMVCLVALAVVALVALNRMIRTRTLRALF